MYLMIILMTLGIAMTPRFSLYKFKPKGLSNWNWKVKACTGYVLCKHQLSEHIAVI